MVDSAKTTPFHERHLAAGGKMVPYAGYQLPVRFGSIVAEHRAVRTAAGLFDVSHMTEFWVEGRGAADAVNAVVSNDLTRIRPGRMQYNLLCTPQGTVVDDLMVYLFGPDRVLLVLNAARREADSAHLREHLPVPLVDRTDETAQLALQGPAAVSILKGLCPRVTGLAALDFVEATVAGVPALVSRSGYTGEDGFEIYCPADTALAVYDALVAAGRDHGLVLAGLGARDTLRLEARLPLYGNELDEETTPFEAGLGWAVALDKPDFVGKAALQHHKKNGRRKRLVGFTMRDKAIARHGYPVLSEDGTPIGTVTSGAPAPTVGKNIGLAYVTASGLRPGDTILIDVRGTKKRAVVVKTPFYKRPRA